MDEVDQLLNFLCVNSIATYKLIGPRQAAEILKMDINKQQRKVLTRAVANENLRNWVMNV